MRKNVALMAVGLALIAGLTAAQAHPNGYACGGINFSKTTTEPTVYIVDGSGNLVSSVAAGANNVHGMVMGPNNKLLYTTSLPWNGAPTTVSGLVSMIDPATGTNVGIAVDFGNINIRDIAIDHNGDLFTGDTFPNDAVYKVDGATKAITTLHAFGSGWDPCEGGVNIDIDTGELLVLGDGNGDNLWLFNRDGSGFTTVASSMVTRFGHTQHIPTGDVYGGTGGSNFLMHLAKGQAAPTVFVSTPGGDNMYCVKADRASAATQTLVGGLWNNSSGLRGLHSVDIATKTITKINDQMNAPGGTSLYECEILYRRNVHSNAAGVGKWAIGIAIPEDAGKKYVMAVGASGVRPGLGFPSGRTAYLNPDAVTFTGIVFGLAPFATGLTGTLSPTGTASGTLDLSSIGSAANGVKLWFLVLTLDNTAPDGIKTITDPHIIKAEGM